KALKQTNPRAAEDFRKNTIDPYVAELDNLDMTSSYDPATGQVIPGAYANARTHYNNSARLQDAMEEGTQALNRSGSENARILSQYDQGEQEAFRIGAAQAMRKAKTYQKLGRPQDLHNTFDQAALEDSLGPVLPVQGRPGQ